MDQLMRRKNIALFTAQPEAAHVIRIINGITAQCRKYAYHVSVFTPMIHMEFKQIPYVRGESEIYRMIELGSIDGLILDAVNLVPGEGKIILDELLLRLKDYPDLPVVSLEMSIGDIPVIKTKNEEALREMCRHAIEVHNKTELCILTGQKGNEVAESRLAVCLDEIGKHGITVSREHIVYGDFWYTSGDALAKRIADKQMEMPEAILCTSTHMALGLIYRLRRLGIRVPEDVIVIGFDTTDEGRCNDVILSAYDAADALSAAEAVDHIRRIIDPGKEIIPYESDTKKMFYSGMSCGCDLDLEHSIQAFRRTAYLVAYNSASDVDMNEVSFGRMMESYCLEKFTASVSPEECFEKMGNWIYLLHPFRNYYICLRDDWLSVSPDACRVYPAKMTTVLSAWETEDKQCLHDLTPVSFDSSRMIPLLDDETLEPSIFYFSPIHFESTTFGYSVLRRSLDDNCTLTLVYRTWLRFINNSLEMARTRLQLLSLAVRDSMTGLFNRRGMNLELEKKLQTAAEGDKLFVAVIDMNGLKTVNDTYGHAEGDYGIMTISTAVSHSARNNELCVRAGGDEFYIIGTGKYTPEDITARKDEFRSVLKKLTAQAGKPYDISASIGCAVETISDKMKIDTVISRADEEMYKEKIEAKNKRIQDQTSSSQTV